MSKKLKLTLGATFITLLFCSVLWSKYVPATIFLKGQAAYNNSVRDLSEIDPDIAMTANGWANTSVNLKISANIRGFVNGKYYAKAWTYTNNTWSETKASGDNLPVSVNYPAFNNTTLKFPSLKDIPVEVSSAEINICIIPPTEIDTEKCLESKWYIHKVKKNPTTSDGALKTASVVLSNSTNIGRIELQNKSDRLLKAQFDTNMISLVSHRAFGLIPELLDDRFPNFALKGVTIKILPLKDGSVKPTYSHIEINNGVFSFVNFRPQNSEKLEMSQELKNAISDFKIAAGFDRLTINEKKDLLDPEVFQNKMINALTPELETRLKNAAEEWEKTASEASRVPMGKYDDLTKPWAAGVWRPEHKSYRVLIEVAPNTAPFALNILDSAENNEAREDINNMMVASKDITLANQMIKEQIGGNAFSPAIRFKKLINKGFTDLPDNADQLNPECREIVTAPLAKMFASLTFSGLTGGVIGKAFGSVKAVAAFGSVANVGDMGNLTSWLTGGVFDGLEGIDWIKFRLAYHYANAFTFKVSELRLNTEELKNGICIGRTANFKAAWFNVCGRPFFGTNTEKSASILLDDESKPIVAVQTVGKAAGLPDWGAGVEVKVTALKKGIARIVVFENDSGLYKSVDVKVDKCTSKQKDPSTPPPPADTPVSPIR